MGWIKDFINKCIAWVVDKVLRPVIDWITDAIAWVIAELRYWKHKFFEMLAEWLENDWFFLGAIAATVCLAIVWPEIVAYLGKSGVVMLLKQVWNKVKEGLASIIDLETLIQLDTINTMLKVLWPDWKAMMAQMSDVVSALAEELGQGTGYIHAYFGVIHGTAIIKNAFLGADPKLGEMEAFEHTNILLKKINEDFRKYAHDPGAIVTDIIEYMIENQAEDLNDAQQAVIEGIRENFNRVKTVNEALHDFEGRVQHFIDIQPEEMSEIISDRLQPFVDKLGDALFVMDTEIMPKINAIVEAIELQGERQQRINDNILARISDPYELLAQAEFMAPEDREALENYIAELESTAADREQAEAKAALDVLADAMVDATKDQYVESEPVRQPARTALSFEMPGTPDTGLIPSWFQGEY